MPLKHFSIQLLTRLPDDLNISTSLLEGKNGGVIGVGEVPFERLRARAAPGVGGAPPLGPSAPLHGPVGSGAVKLSGGLLS